MRPLLLLTPSPAAGVELPRRLAASGRALAGVYRFTLPELARAIGEPALLGAGLGAWDAGHDALLASRLLDGPHGAPLGAGLPRAPLAAALARTLSALRRAGVAPERVDAFARGAHASREDAARLAALAGLYRAYHESLEGALADPAQLLRAARDRLSEAGWLRGMELLVVEDLELEPLELELLAALARLLPTRRLARPRPQALARGSFAAWADAHGILAVAWQDTLLAPIAPAAAPAGLARLREALFEPPSGPPVRDGSVELVAAAGEAAEVRAIARRLLRAAARGVPFEQMGVLLPNPREYAPLLTDLLERLGIPHRLHPSLPLRFGRCARSLLLLFRCRRLERSAVLEFLSFAPIPFAALLGDDAPRRTRWDQIARDAGVVEGYERWLLGLRAYEETEREAAQRAGDATRREQHLARAQEAEALLRAVELLNATLVGLDGEATWPEWADRLRGVLEQWLGPERDRQAVAEVVADLAGLAAVAGGRAAWAQVEQVLEARFEWERLPLEPLSAGAVHVGALDALAGLPFRVLAIAGLVEGGYPGLLRPDPFLLDPEREALRALASPATPAEPERPARRSGRAPRAGRQLSLFEPPAADPAGPAAAPAEGPGPAPLPTTQDRLLEARRDFQRALGQATEHLVLSYPRADPRTGRERMPSLFFVAAASALAGQPLGGAQLAAWVVEDDPAHLELEDAVDASERDRMRVARGGSEAVLAIAAGAPCFKWSHLAQRERWSERLTAFDGRVAGLPAELARRLDPLTSPRPVSASSLATYAKCGFLYLLRHVLGIQPAEEPEQRLGLDALEQGLLFHEVAEAYLRERRERGLLPVRDDAAGRERLLEIARERVNALVAGTPPRHRLVWELRWRAFEDLLARWLAREAAAADRRRPAHFEVGFGLGTHAAAADEPHSAEPLVVDLGAGRELKLAGKIDRIDVRPDGALVLRDYKTGRAPKDDGSVFRGGRELQIPIYVLATRMLFPGREVAEAFLDYVGDNPRPIGFDPASIAGETFRRLLLEMTAAIAEGVFAQEPGSCRFCDFTDVCGPAGLIEMRQRFKLRDPALQRYLRLRDYR